MFGYVKQYIFNGHNCELYLMHSKKPMNLIKLGISLNWGLDNRSGWMLDKWGLDNRSGWISGGWIIGAVG